jgi:hypothetical protein
VRRKQPNYGLREHWRAVVVFMAIFGALYFVQPVWLQLVGFVLWFVAFSVVTRVSVRRAERNRTGSA